MPQNRLETSRRIADALDAEALFSALHATLVETVGASLGACKSRVVVIEQVVVADGGPDKDMAHLDIGLLAGRTAEQKTQLGEAALKLLRLHVEPAAPGLDLSLSVRLYDMHQGEYFK